MFIIFCTNTSFSFPCSHPDTASICVPRQVPANKQKPKEKPPRTHFHPSFFLPEANETVSVATQRDYADLNILMLRQYIRTLLLLKKKKMKILPCCQNKYDSEYFNCRL